MSSKRKTFCPNKAPIYKTLCLLYHRQTVCRTKTKCPTIKTRALLTTQRADEKADADRKNTLAWYSAQFLLVSTDLLLGMMIYGIWVDLP